MEINYVSCDTVKTKLTRSEKQSNTTFYEKTFKPAVITLNDTQGIYL
jgi:hypothetical protein